MSAIQSKAHISIDGHLFMIARQVRTNRHIYGREEAPSFVNKFSSGDPNYRDATFYPHWVQNNWLNGFDQEKFNDGGKFYRSSQVDPTVQEKLTLQKAVDSAGTIAAGQPKAFGLRSASSQGWWNTNYGYRRQLTVTAPAANALAAGHPIKVTIDTAALQTASKVQADRDDWRIIYVNGSTFVDLTRDYVSASVTFFPLQTAIAAGQTDGNYYAYYGYSSESTNKQPTTEALWNEVYFGAGWSDASTEMLYHFREGSGTSVADDGPQAHTGTLNGTTSWTTGNDIGRGVDFGGSGSDYMDIGDIEMLECTFEAWINLDGNPNDYDSIFRKQGDPSQNAPYYFGITSGRKVSFGYNSGGPAHVTGSTTLSTGQLYHVAGTYDGSNIKVWVNGVVDGTAAHTASQITSGETTRVGRGLNGKIFHARASNVARTSFPYAMAAEPTYTDGGELAQAAIPASGTFEIYAGASDGKVYLWDGATTWTEVFDTRRLTWFDTTSVGDTDHIVGDTGGTETAQAQSFQLAATTKVKAISLRLKKNAGTPGDITVRVETNNAGDPSGTLADAAATGTITAFSTTSYDWVTVTFATAFSLTASTTYWIKLTTAAAANDNNYAWHADASSPTYTSGNASHSSDGGSTWAADTGDDFLFRVLGEATQVNQITQATFSGTTKLWFAVGDPTNTNAGGARIYTYDGTTWALNKTFTGVGSAAALCLQVYGSTTPKLYVGLAPTAIVSVTSDGVTWTTSKDIDEPNNPGYVWDMEVYNGRLYAAGGHPEYVSTNNSQGFLFSYDEFSWSFIYDFSFTVIKYLKVFDNLLFLGTVNKRLYVYNTASMDKLLEFPWDVSINAMEVYDDKLAVGLGATNSLTGQEAIYLFDRNGFHKAFVVDSVGINAMISGRNQLLFGTTSTTIRKVSSNTYVASATLQSSYFEAGLPNIDKKWRTLAVFVEALPSGCSVLFEYKTDEADASWTTIGTISTAGDTFEEFEFSDTLYSKKISIRYTLATSNNLNTPTVKVVDVRYVLMPDFKYLWKMTLACVDNIVWLDGTEPISTTAETIDADEASLDLADASGFPTKGRAVVVDGSTEDEFTWTGKSTNTLTGCVGLSAHATSGLTVKMTGATMHKQLLVMKQTKSLFDYVDIDGLTYSILFHGFQPDGFSINQDNGIENNVPITLLEA